MWRVAIGFRVFRQTSGPLPSTETEERRNRSASDAEVEAEGKEIRRGEKSEKDEEM